MNTKRSWKELSPDIYALSVSGKTLKEIGDTYGVTREYIRQVLKRYYPDLEAESRGASVRVRAEKRVILSERKGRYGRDAWPHLDDLSRAKSQCFTRKKQNAKYSKWGWDVKINDVVFPTHCPIIGIELDWFAEYRADNSPSFNRIDPTKGYTPENTIICSWRANRIKNNGTAEEHEKIAEFIRNHELP